MLPFLASVAVADFAVRARRYATLLREHIAKENNVLFPMADGMLDERDQEDVLERFESIEHLDLGEGAHERYLALARRVAERLGVKRSESPAGPAGVCCSYRRDAAQRPC